MATKKLQINVHFKSGSVKPNGLTEITFTTDPVEIKKVEILALFQQKQILTLRTREKKLGTFILLKRISDSDLEGTLIFRALHEDVNITFADFHKWSDAKEPFVIQISRKEENE